MNDTRPGAPTERNRERAPGKNRSNSRAFSRIVSVQALDKKAAASGSESARFHNNSTTSRAPGATSQPPVTTGQSRRTEQVTGHDVDALIGSHRNRIVE